MTQTDINLFSKQPDELPLYGSTLIDIMKRQDKLEALLKELAETLLETTKRAAETDNRLDEVINIINGENKLLTQ